MCGQIVLGLLRAVVIQFTSIGPTLDNTSTSSGLGEQSHATVEAGVSARNSDRGRLRQTPGD
jgi:hypothetical protein